MSEPSLVYAVTEQNFEQEVIQKSHTVPVVVDFWAPWCGPCRSLTPLLERLVQQRAGEVVLAKINTDEEQGLAMSFGVSSIPMVVAFREGRPILQFVGLLSEPELVSFLDRICPSEIDKLAREAESLEKTNPAQAEKLYRQVLQKDAHYESANLGLVRLLIARNEDAEAAEVLETIGVGTQQPDEAERLGAILWLRRQAQVMGDEKTLRERLDIDPNSAQLHYELGTVLAGAGNYPEALQHLLKAGELDRKLAVEKVRETMVQVFHVVGVRSELANEYRDQLSAILY